MATEQNKPNEQNIGATERVISSVGGGVLAFYGLSRRDVSGLALAALGGYVLYRGASGQSPEYKLVGINTARAVDGQTGIKVEKQVTINKRADELYRFWRNFENLPRFMKHLESVKVSGDTHSHWVANAPAGASVEWDAEITDDSENNRIAWRSLPGSQVMNSGEVRFVPATGNRGTEVHVALIYEPPAGVLGALIAKLFGEEPNQQVGGDLQRFKNLMETGEIPTVIGQSSGRVGEVEKQRAVGAGAEATSQPQKPDQLGPRNPLTKALEDTFPASDPAAPALTPGDNTGVATDEHEIGLGRKIY